jgi:DNA polymerase-4
MIVHLRVVPGFWIAVEAGRRPELLSLPVIMGGLPHQRGTVREVSRPAQYRGIRVGMTLAQAQQYCPDGIFLTPDLPRYQAVWADVCGVLAELTPLVEPLEMGQAVCDIAGSERRWRDVREAMLDIIARVNARTGIIPWLGIASNRVVAELASLQVDAEGFTAIAPGQERTFLADLPLTLLPDVDARLALTFQILGLRTMKQFADLPRNAVKQRFGPLGERLHGYARGIDARPVVPPPSRPAITARRDCEEGTIEEAVEILHRLAASCAQELEQQALAATLVGLTLVWKGEDEGKIASRIPLSGPVEAVAELPGSLLLSEEGRDPFPVSYRIHSMLPQPNGGGPHPPAPSPAAAGEGEILSLAGVASIQDQSTKELPLACRSGRGGWGVRATTPPISPLTTRTAITRIPITTAAALFERARQLLLQSWPPQGEANHQLQAIELKVSEFAQPRQLGFAELNRLDQSGGLAGLDSGRLQALSQQEAVLAARYGDASFRHVSQLDPSSILTERRFSWAAGLPWKEVERRTGGRAAGRKRR